MATGLATLPLEMPVVIEAEVAISSQRANFGEYDFHALV
jgi:hypothetical protein